MLYTGVSLWMLIQDAGLLTDPAIKNDLLGFAVVATGSDGYRAVISLGEIAPMFGNQPDLVAYSDTAGQLGPNGSDGALASGGSRGSRRRSICIQSGQPAGDRHDGHASRLSGMGRRVTHPYEVHRLHAQNHLAVLVQHLQKRVDQPAIRLGA
jgi:hypothetical protein